MDDHDRRFDKLEDMVEKGFEATQTAIASLRDSESRRKGAMGIVKLLFAGTGLAGLVELVKDFLHR